MICHLVVELTLAGSMGEDKFKERSLRSKEVLLLKGGVLKPAAEVLPELRRSNGV